MELKLTIPGVALALIGIALTADFDLSGSHFPDNPIEMGGWAALLLGFFLLKLAATREN